MPIPCVFCRYAHGTFTQLMQTETRNSFTGIFFFLLLYVTVLMIRFTSLNWVVLGKGWYYGNGSGRHINSEFFRH
uniref:Uncharacterized protein n=1 Tax=Rhizophora mucronata TaxID=61149 RepID=A0A2P2JCK7_RHIMU